jgi:alanyl-tRNA synthetase
MKLSINKENRTAKMRAHSATHLLHAELNKILRNTKQAGSLVDNDYLRFDFHTDKPLTLEQIQTIE